MSKKVIVTQVRSKIGHPRDQFETLKALGLGRIGKEIVHVLNPCVIGMLKKVNHLIVVKDYKK